MATPAAEARIARGRQATRDAAVALRTMLATTNYSHDDWCVLVGGRSVG